jgi:hypothetical protein
MSMRSLSVAAAAHDLIKLGKRSVHEPGIPDAAGIDAHVQGRAAQRGV